jgi:hypothetical protein
LEELHSYQEIASPEDFLVLVHPQLGLHLVVKTSVALGVAQWTVIQFKITTFHCWEELGNY